MYIRALKIYIVTLRNQILVVFVSTMERDYLAFLGSKKTGNDGKRVIVQVFLPSGY